MSVTIKKQSDGRLLARMESAPEYYCLACEDVIIDDTTMRIWHYVVTPRDSPPFIVWVFNKMTMTVLSNRENVNGPAIGYSGGDHTSVRVIHNEPHLLIVPDLSNGQAFHTNMQGHVFSGSNTFGGRWNLCLGDSFAPYDFSAVHLLCNYNANADLGWQGAHLIIEQPITNNQRIVTRWPTIPNTRITIPQLLTGFFNPL